MPEQPAPPDVGASAEPTPGPAAGAAALELAAVASAPEEVDTMVVATVVQAFAGGQVGSNPTMRLGFFGAVPPQNIGVFHSSSRKVVPIAPNAPYDRSGQKHSE